MQPQEELMLWTVEHGPLHAVLCAVALGRARKRTAGYSDKHQMGASVTWREDVTRCDMVAWHHGHPPSCWGSSHIPRPRYAPCIFTHTK